MQKMSILAPLQFDEEVDWLASPLATPSGLPVDVSWLPPLPLSIFIGSSQKLSAPAPGSAARSAHCRKSGQPLDTSRRSLDPDKICPANPTPSPFRQVPDECQQTLSN